MSANRLGASSSTEHRSRISAALTGKPLSEEHRRKVAAVNADPVLSKKKGESRRARRKTPETHRSVHRRLFRDKGPASDHSCVDCSGSASAWTHGWNTWEDIAQELCGKRLTFSTNLAAYEPRCCTCHNRLDRAPRAWDPVGHRQGARLTEADVAWIRTCGLSLSAMSRALGVGISTIGRARQGVTWTHLA